MACHISRKTSGSPRGGPKIKIKTRPRGAASLVAIFLVMVFTVVGLGVACLTQVYVKALFFRRHALRLDYAAENGVKRGLAEILTASTSGPGIASVSAGEYESLRGDAQADGLRPLLAALGVPLPVSIEESVDDLAWTAEADARPASLADHESWFSARYAVKVEASGRTGGVAAHRDAGLDAEADVVAGRVPLAFFPLLLASGLREEDRPAVEIRRGPADLASRAPVENAGPAVLPDDGTRLLEKTLKIRVFSPQDLAPAKLRQALGLEPSTDPVPDGVYLVRDDMGLGGVFVQGDLEELVPAVDGAYQAIRFTGEAGEWTLRFSPALSRTEFAAPEGTSAYDRVPNGLIFVNGKIASLAGGVCDVDGRPVPTADPTVPSILRGVGLTIVSSDRITLTSHLTLQGVAWRDGLPYLQDSQAQLVIFSTGRDLLRDEDREGGIIIDAGAPRDVSVHGSLTASGRVAVEGAGKIVDVLGGIQAADLVPGDNRLRITADGRLAAGLIEPAEGPVAGEPVLAVAAFRVLAWRE